MNKRFGKVIDLALSLCAISLLHTATASAQADPFATGVKQFGAKTYGLAALNFKKAIAANPKNDSARYYYALCLHYNNDVAGATKAYADLIRALPNSNGANYARTALGKLDAALLSTLPGGEVQYAQPAAAQPSARNSNTSGVSITTSAAEPRGSKVRSSSDDHIPDECRIYFTLEHNLFVIDAYLNGRPMKMLFDTGAEDCAFGKDTLASVGIAPPKGKSTGTAHGVGDGGAQATWDMTADIKVGTIERKNFEISVQDNMNGLPLLGQSFFQDFTYTIDNGAHSIHFVRKRKNAGSAYSDPSRDPNAVPFTRQGNELVVNVEINGKPTQLYFDTGASSVSLTKQQCTQLGLVIPEDAERITVNGIAGSTQAREFNVRMMRMGGITRHDFPVHVADSEKMGLGLLGQTFYNDYQYTIDYQRGYIHFLRR